MDDISNKSKFLFEPSQWLGRTFEPSGEHRGARRAAFGTVLKFLALHRLEKPESRDDAALVSLRCADSSVPARFWRHTLSARGSILYYGVSILE